MTPATFSDRKLVAPTLPICRQFERGECDKAACKWAHVEMYDNVRRIRGEVQVCGDFLRNACNRIDCKFFHAPPEWNLHRSKKCVAVCEKFMNNECFLLQSECNAAHPEDSNVLTDVSVSVCVEYLIDPLRCSGTDCRCYHPPEDHVLFQQLRKQVLAQKARLEQKAEVLPQRGNVSLKILNNSTRPGNAGAARGGRGTARGGHQSSTAREGGAALPPGVSSGNLRSLSSIGAGGASRGRAQQRPPPKLQQIPSTVGNNPMATSIDFGDLGGSIDASELEFPLQTGDDFDLTGGDQDYDIIDPSGTEKQIHMDLDAGDEIDENGNLVCREVLGEDNLLLTSTDGPGRGSSVSGMDRGGDHGGRKARSLDRYGRERCSDFKLGRCNRGMNCKFSHDRGDDFEPPPGGVSNAGGGLFSSGVGGQSAIRGGAPQQNNSAFIPGVVQHNAKYARIFRTGSASAALIANFHTISETSSPVSLVLPITIRGLLADHLPHEVAACVLHREAEEAEEDEETVDDDQEVEGDVEDVTAHAEEETK
ncbi:unnamed protein product [Amoebophrya sp. A25]|nr:unnamed protein product [Amoebophrya sp. A25]|eukprot:GSA25T00018028001.1